jgi:hypothetical protein
MPKLEFDLTDFVGPLAVAAVFALVLLTLSFFCINFCFIGGDDSLTIFEKVTIGDLCDILICILKYNIN